MEPKLEIDIQASIPGFHIFLQEYNSLRLMTYTGVYLTDG